MNEFDAVELEEKEELEKEVGEAEGIKNEEVENRNGNGAEEVEEMGLESVIEGILARVCVFMI